MKPSNRLRFWILLVSYVVCVAFTISGISTAISRSIAASPDLHNPWDYIIDFDQRMEEYKSSRSSHNIVIVGPSYASNLGTFDSAYNLGLGSANHKDVAHMILQDCRKSDTIFYVLTVREALLASEPLTTWLACKESRRLAVLKLLFGTFPEQSDPYALFGDWPSALEFQLLSSVANIEESPLASQVIRHIRIFSSQHGNFSFPFRAIYKKHPNVVFVLHPTLPFGNPSLDETEFAGQIRALKTDIERFRKLFAVNQLPYVDLTDSMDTACFRDLFHLTMSVSHL